MYIFLLFVLHWYSDMHALHFFAIPLFSIMMVACLLSEAQGAHGNVTFLYSPNHLPDPWPSGFSTGQRIFFQSHTFTLALTYGKLEPCRKSRQKMTSAMKQPWAHLYLLYCHWEAITFNVLFCFWKNRSLRFIFMPANKISFLEFFDFICKSLISLSFTPTIFYYIHWSSVSWEHDSNYHTPSCSTLVSSAQIHSTPSKKGKKPAEVFYI